MLFENELRLVVKCTVKTLGQPLKRVKKKYNLHAKKRGKCVEDKSRTTNRKQLTNMVDINPTISIITLNVNCLNIPIRRQTLSDWIKNNTQFYVFYKEPTLNIKTHTD